MKKKVLINELLLGIVPLIWGVAFVYQDIGNSFLSPIIFSGFRCLIGSVFLFVVTIVRFIILKILKKPIKLFNKRELIYGMILGLVTSIAMSLQQIGIKYEGAGKSGFITSLYIVFVPIIGILFHKKTNIIVVISLMIAITGLYFINVHDGSFSFDIGLVLLLISSIFYALQILLIDKFSPECETINLSMFQFLFATIIQLPIAFLIEDVSFEYFNEAIPSLIFCGLLSTGVAFTIQIYAQKNVPVVLASMIMSLEAVFAIIFSAIILHSRYSLIEILGCVLIFIAVLIVQIPIKTRKEKQADIKK